MTPKRIQMSRQHPWRADHPDAVIVARPSKWGNPYVIGSAGANRDLDRVRAVRAFRLAMLSDPALIVKAIVELSGKDLACWCALDQPCHADVLLEMANGGGTR